MTTSKNWADEWLKAQQNIVGAWAGMAQGLSSTDTVSQSSLWAESLELWQKNYLDNASDDARQVIDKCMEMGKSYFTMAEQMGKAATSDSNPYEILNSWFDQLKTGLQGQANEWSPMSGTNLNELMSQWFSPASSWQKMTEAMLPAQQSFGQIPGIGASAFNIGDTINPLGNLPSAPGLGFFRETQEKLQTGIQLALDYQQSNAKFNQAILSVSIESIQGFQQQLQNRVTGQDERAMPSSLRELYDEWVDVSEEYYAKFAMGEEYQALYGNMVNRLMALKKHYGEMTDDMMKRMNLPARSEIDTMQIRLQQLRRDNFELQKELKEIRSLLTKKKPPSVKKAVARKSSAKKKVNPTTKSKAGTGS